MEPDDVPQVVQLSLRELRLVDAVLLEAARRDDPDMFFRIFGVKIDRVASKVGAYKTYHEAAMAPMPFLPKPSQR